MKYIYFRVLVMTLIFTTSHITATQEEFIPLTAQELISLLQKSTPEEMVEKILNHAKLTCELIKFESTINMPLKANVKVQTLQLIDGLCDKLAKSFDQGIIALKAQDGAAAFNKHLMALTIDQLKQIDAAAIRVLTTFEDSVLPAKKNILEYYQLIFDYTKTELNKRLSTKA